MCLYDSLTLSFLHHSLKFLFNKLKHISICENSGLYVRIKLILYLSFLSKLNVSLLLWYEQLSSNISTLFNSKLLCLFNLFFMILINQVNLFESTELLHNRRIHDPLEQTARMQLIDPVKEQFLTSSCFPLIPQEYFVLISLFKEDLYIQLSSYQLKIVMAEAQHVQ